MEGGAGVLAALRPHPPAVELDEFLADGQAEAGAADVAGHRIVESLERLEEPAEIVLADADAGVAHGDVDDVAVQPNGDGDPSARRELDGIRQQVEQDLADLRPVPRDVGQVDADVLLELDRLAA